MGQAIVQVSRRLSFSPLCSGPLSSESGAGLGLSDGASSVPDWRQRAQLLPAEQRDAAEVLQTAALHLSREQAEHRVLHKFRVMHSDREGS